MYLREGGLRYRHINLKGSIFTLVGAVFFLSLNGCVFPVMWSNPGFMIDIDVEKIKKEQILTLESLLINQDYNLFSARRKDKRCVQYSKIITTDKQTEHPVVDVLLCYDENKELDKIAKFGVLIINAWEGQRPEIKNEINRIGNIMYDELTTMVGKDNISIKRKTTGPPF